MLRGDRVLGPFITTPESDILIASSVGKPGQDNASISTLNEVSPIPRPSRDVGPTDRASPMGQT